MYFSQVRTHRFFVSFFMIALLLMCFSFGDAFAQTTPTAFEQQVGGACKKASHSTDFDTLVQCTSTGTTSGTYQKAPLFVGAVTAPPYGNTTCDTSKAGMMQYDGTNMLYCDGSAWKTLPTKTYVDASASGGGSTTRKSQTFTASGTWTRPEGVTSVDILAVAGGGGAGGCFSTAAVSAGAGGGEIVWSPKTPVSADLVITIGGGGAGGAFQSTHGKNGGNTTVGSLVTARGGLRGYSGQSYSSSYTLFGGSGAGGACLGGVSRALQESSAGLTRSDEFALEGQDGHSCATSGGGGGVGGSVKVAGIWYPQKGGDGGMALFPYFSTGLPGKGSIGATASSHGPGGGGASFSGQAGHAKINSAGGNATGYGGGGGGCSSNSYVKSGGNGAPGLVILYWDE